MSIAIRCHTYSKLYIVMSFAIRCHTYRYVLSYSLQLCCHNQCYMLSFHGYYVVIPIVILLTYPLLLCCHDHCYMLSHPLLYVVMPIAKFGSRAFRIASPTVWNSFRFTSELSQTCPVFDI